MSLNTFSSTSSSESPSPPLESQHVVTSLPSSPITASIPIATTASASSSATTLEESSPRHFQHPSPRTQQQSLVSQVTKVCIKVLWNRSSLLGFQSLFLVIRKTLSGMIVSFCFLVANYARANSTAFSAGFKRELHARQASTH